MAFVTHQVRGKVWEGRFMSEPVEGKGYVGELRCGGVLCGGGGVGSMWEKYV